MEKEDVVSLIKQVTESQNKELLTEVGLMIEDALSKVTKSKGGLSKAEAQQLINDTINVAKLGGSPAPAVTANPDFDPKGKYEVLDKVKVMPTKGNTYHKQGEPYVIEGHQATMQIRKGYCTLVSEEHMVEKYVPKKNPNQVKVLSKVE